MRNRDVLAILNKGGSGGGVTSWNDLTDKPFGEEIGEAEITWDGDTTGLETFAGEYAKLDCVPPSVENLLGHTIVVNVPDGDDVTITIDENSLTELPDGGYKIEGLEVSLVVLVTKYTEGFTPGFWLFYVPEGSIYVSKITYSAEVVKPLDEKYLPESVKGGSGGVNETIVTFTNNVMAEAVTCNKTYEECSEAINSGNVVVNAITTVGDVPFQICRNLNINAFSKTFLFTAVVETVNGPMVVTYSYAEDGTIAVTETALEVGR